MIAALKDEAQLEALKGKYRMLGVVFLREGSRVCRRFLPYLEETAPLLSEDCALVIADADKLQSLTEKLGVRSLPTLAIFCLGQRQRLSVGIQSPAALLELLR